MPPAFDYKLLLLGVVCVVPLILGFRDILQFSLTRALAVASVAFHQSIRRRVLLILPPVILAIIAVNQFQRASDARDMIRQTTNICLMATGLVALLVTLMGACTSIPREIESRVIYTIATKPITRLEILLGKVIGFSGVSLLILGLMGLFTWGFLRWEVIRLPASSGRGDLLRADVYSNPRGLGFLGDAPDEKGRLWLAGGSDGLAGSIYIPFHFKGAELFDDNGVAGSMTVKIPLSARLKPSASPSTLPSTLPASSRLPKVAVEFRNMSGATFISPGMVFPGGVVLDSPQGSSLQFTLTSELVAKFFNPTLDSQFVICVINLSNDFLLHYDDNTCKIFGEFKPPIEQNKMDRASYVGPRGKYGFRLQGGPDIGRFGLINFRFDPVRFNRPTIPCEFRAEIESDQSDILKAGDCQLSILFTNNKTRQTHQVSISPESGNTLIFDIPASIAADGDFSALFQSPTPQAWFTLHVDANPSLRIILSSQTYAWNLIKALIILWLFLILATIISLSCSTFLSWPIAITLTILMLISRYIYIQLGDLAKPGLGNTIVSDLLGNKGAEVSRAVSSSVDALIGVYNWISSFFPDISQFRVMEELNQGAAVSMQSLAAALLVAAGFGLPIFAIGWLILRHKEVAP